ncbi:MAG: hypothetical protein AB7P69_11755 [Candidatus Binatia bacterium]
MKHLWGWIFVFLALGGCYQRQDPLVRAAQDLQQLSYEFAEREEERRQQFNLLELGMSDKAVIEQIGPPSSRQSMESGLEERRERWTYQRAMQTPALLIFTNQQLTEIHLE